MKALFNSDNITRIVKALAMSLFFSGTGLAFELLLPKKNWSTALLMVGLAIVILLVDDGSLSELYDLKPSQTAAAVHGTKREK